MSALPVRSSAVSIRYESMLRPRLTEARWNGIHVATALELLGCLPSSCAEIVILDLPEQLARECHHFSDMPATPVDELLTELTPLASECARVLHEGGSTVLLGSAAVHGAWEVAASWAGLSPAAGLTVLWDTTPPAELRGRQRGNDGNTPQHVNTVGTLATPIRRHVKPGLRLPSLTRLTLPSNVLICHEVPLDERYAAVQRPIELFSYIINTMTEPRGSVVDPLCGTGSSLVAATQLGRRWVGGDVEPSMVDIAVTRVKRAGTGHEFIYTQPMYWWVAGDKRILVEG